jgi:hypothetical protein
VGPADVATASRVAAWVGVGFGTVGVDGGPFAGHNNNLFASLVLGSSTILGRAFPLALYAILSPGVCDAGDINGDGGGFAVCNTWAGQVTWPRSCVDCVVLLTWLGLVYREMAGLSGTLDLPPWARWLRLMCANSLASWRDVGSC